MEQLLPLVALALTIGYFEALFWQSIFILWPVFQPMGQLVTLINDGLTLPLLAALGFAEAFVLMLVLIYFAARYYRRHRGAVATAQPLAPA